MTTHKIAWGTTTDFTLTNLHSLAGGNIWVSNAYAEGSPSSEIAQISYTLVCDSSVAADEQIIFRIAKGDDDGTEIRDAGISTSEQEISTANTISDIQDTLNPVKVVRIDRVSQTLKGVFNVYDPGPDWQLLIELDSASGALAASGNVASYRMGTGDST